MKRVKMINTLFRLLGIVLSLVFTALVLVISNADPLEAYKIIISGAVATPVRIADVVVAFVPLIITTCGLAITFTVGLWNIGIEGQIMLGAIMATWALRLLQDSSLSPGIVIITGFFAGMIGGMLWALLAGFLKLYGGVNEIFAGLGLNFIATAMTIWLIFGPWKRPGVASMSGTVPFDKALSLPTLPGFRLSLWSLVLVAFSVLVVFLFLNSTKIGLRMKAVGKNPKAAILMGVSSSKHLLLAFLMCGFFAGLTGAFQVIGVYNRLIPAISSGYGFLGLLVAMLVDYHVIWAVPVALLYAALNIGGIQLPITMKIDSTLAGVMQSALVLFYMAMEGVRRKYWSAVERQENE